MSSVEGSESVSVSTEDQDNLIGSADAGAVAAAAAAAPVAEYPGPISYCSRDHALVEVERSWTD